LIMIVGGLEKLTLIDFPGCLSAIIFTKSCNFRCHYCYNPMLVWPDEGTDGKNKKEKDQRGLGLEDLFLFLEERFGRLDGVVISGGEPTLHQDLPEFIRRIKDIGYKIKLDTNGTNPEMLEKLISEKLLDYIAMDIKAPFSRYKEVVNVDLDFSKLEKSVKIIKESNLPHEFRTTVVPGLLAADDFEEMGRSLTGAMAWYLQKVKSDTVLVDGTYEGKAAYTQKEMLKFSEIGKKYVASCQLRD